ncbi:hypothetical protein Pcinc_038482 [Petrolisthes cinctipes]|uniref:Uncharacterized protein n=1 Tax=Petrolisthes cinctipes TaxID=88211 RepID=A0AAE1BRF7_PETCI|nr:hypothetical protein Pcinc_038482 [Petrolisthes cinctipes]
MVFNVISVYDAEPREQTIKLGYTKGKVNMSAASQQTNQLGHTLPLWTINFDMMGELGKVNNSDPACDKCSKDVKSGGGDEDV